MDYYQRKFPGKSIQKMYILANQEQHLQLQALMSDLGIPSKFIDFARIIGKPIAYSAGLVKSYSAAIESAVSTKVKINLVETRTHLPKAAVATGSPEDAFSLFRDIMIDYRTILLGVLICLSVLGYGIYKAAPFKQKLREVISNRVKVDKIDDSLSSDQLAGINSAYESKLNKLDALIRRQLYLTETLDVIPRFIPEGVWLVSFVLNNRERDRVELILDGKSYLRDSDKEFEAVNKFLEDLKQEPTFTKYFTDISILSINQQQEDRVTVTSFSLSCKNYKEGR